MSTVSCTDSDKERFEALQESGETQAEAMSRILDMAEAFEGEVVDVDEWAEQTADKIGPKIELSMYRVANELTDVELAYNE